MFQVEERLYSIRIIRMSQLPQRLAYRPESNMELSCLSEENNVWVNVYLAGSPSIVSRKI